VTEKNRAVWDRMIRQLNNYDGDYQLVRDERDAIPAVDARIRELENLIKRQIEFPQVGYCAIPDFAIEAERIRAREKEKA